MKKGIFTLAVLVAGIVMSCNRVQVEEPVKGPVTLEISGLADGYTTKSMTVASETAVKKLEVMVFNSSGVLDGYVKLQNPSAVSGKYTVTLNCSRASGMTVCAFANSVQDIKATSLAAYKSLVSYLKDNTKESLQMAAISSGVDLTAGTATVGLDRFAAKIEIDRISNEFLHDLTVDRIYMINVNPTCPYSMAPTAAPASDWINRRAYAAGQSDALLFDTVGKTVVPGGNLQESHFFYAYPNPVTVDSSVASGDFTPRYTRLVVEGTLDGAKTYYPVNIVRDGGALDSNTLYRITDLKISGPGSNSPDVLPSRGSVSVTVTITDWKTGFSKEVIY